MRTLLDASPYSRNSIEGSCDSLLLGRLGSELALIYHDTLQSPLPPGLQALIDRLDHDSASARGHRGEELIDS